MSRYLMFEKILPATAAEKPTELPFVNALYTFDRVDVVVWVGLRTGLVGVSEVVGVAEGGLHNEMTSR